MSLAELFKLAVNVAITLALIVYYSVLCVIKQLVPYRFRTRKTVSGEVTLVTGAGSGLGRLTAKKLAKLGARLVLVDVDQRGNEQTAKEIESEGGCARAFTCDLSSREEIYRVANEIKQTVGDVQILINNAGIVTGKKFLDSTDKAIEKTFQVNTMSHFWLGKAFLPSMIEKDHGHVVTIASVAGLFGTAGLCDYCSSKFAAVGFEESLRNELARQQKYGVKTTVVCPFYIKTGMFDGVETDIIPMMEPEYVTDKIIEAILTNQKVLYLPKIFYFFTILKNILPVEVQHFVANQGLRTNFNMDKFIGRAKKE